NMPKHAKTFQNIPKHAKTCQNMPKGINNILKNIFHFILLLPNLPFLSCHKKGDLYYPPSI
ncbi:hypothetical protein MY604_10375, partial [Haemophilus influenzae]|nr:hypothetical protein [Haemophilus influenzae]